MSQPPVTAYFNTRKRQACDDLRGKSKILLLESDNSTDQTSMTSENSEHVARNEKAVQESPRIIFRDVSTVKEEHRANKVVRNIHFDSPTMSTEKTQQSTPRARATRNRKLLSTEGQADIRDSLQKMSNKEETKKVPFEKKGALSPKKPTTFRKGIGSSDTPKETVIEEDKNEQLPASSLTPTKKASRMEKLANIGLEEIKDIVKKSPRLIELKAHIARFGNKEQQLQEFQKRDNVKKPQMQKFEKIELEVPVSPQKGYKSPIKALLTPTKDRSLSKTASPQRRILFEPKETTSRPVKSSPEKTYLKFLSLTESITDVLPLPYTYRFLAEVFRSVDTISAMLFNRKELITFNKLKPAVQELLRHNFTLEHLAQIKTIYPDAYTYHQEKQRNFGLNSKQGKYELVLTPVIKANDRRNTPDADNVLKSASESNMGPAILLERRRKFYKVLLEKVKDEHEKFLLNLEDPINMPKEKVMQWHPHFDVASCKEIEQAELPQPPHIENTTAKDVLDKAKSLFKIGTPMEKALQRLAEANLTSKSTSPTSVQDSTTQTIEDNIRKVNIAIVDTPPTTPSTRTNYVDQFKGIPKALLEKVRAKQAAKALETMTRTPNKDKEAILYSRLPELAKILRNIFVAEKKGVLLLETVIQKLDNSFRTKLTPHETEEHIRLLCKLLPMWTSIRNVRKANYLKLDKDADVAKMIKRLEMLANDKVKA